MPNAKIIGQRIKELRTGLNMTQEQFAEKIHVRQCTLANYENGFRIPKDSTKSLIAHELGSSVEDIFYRAE